MAKKSSRDFPTVEVTQSPNGARATDVVSPPETLDDNPSDTPPSPFIGVPFSPAPDLDDAANTDDTDAADTSILKRLRRAETYAEDLETTHEPEPVSFRKPTSMDWIRVRPGNDWCVQAYLLAPRGVRVPYLVLHDEVEKRLKRRKQGKSAILYTAMDRSGSLFLWAVGMAIGASGRNEWNASSHRAAVLAHTTWVQLISNQGRGLFEVETTTKIPPPVWPDVPTFEAMIQDVFDGLIIDHEDHGVLQDLWGL